MSAAKQVNLHSLANLGTVKWKPGQSGNPAGRAPKHYSILEAIKLLAERPEGFAIQNPTNIEAVAMQIWRKAAADGAMPAIQELLERFDGKVRQDAGVSGNITITVRYENGEDATE